MCHQKHGIAHAGKRSGWGGFIRAAYMSAETTKKCALPNMLGKIGGLDVSVTHDVGPLPISGLSLVHVVEHSTVSHAAQSSNASHVGLTFSLLV